MSVNEYRTLRITKICLLNVSVCWFIRKLSGNYKGWMLVESKNEDCIAVGQDHMKLIPLPMLYKHWPPCEHSSYQIYLKRDEVEWNTISRKNNEIKKPTLFDSECGPGNIFRISSMGRLEHEVTTLEAAILLKCKTRKGERDKKGKQKLTIQI